MKISRAPLIALALAVGGCIYNPSIDQEIADKCGISVSDYQQAEALLEKSRDGSSLNAGRCRLTRTSKGVTEGVVIDQ